MDSAPSTCELKSALLRDVAYICRNAGRRWHGSIGRTLREIRHRFPDGVLFGGTLRSLLVSRVFSRRLGRPRDVDIVVAGTTVDALRAQFKARIARETRFGGLKLRCARMEFDVWPLDRTWAFAHAGVASPSFQALPQTTFLNIEAIAVDIWPDPGTRRRRIYSGDDQFFHGIRTRTVEINRQDNPFPALCVVRALIMATSIDFAIGPRLAKYIAHVGRQLSVRELEEIQRHHYGTLRYYGSRMRELIGYVADASARDGGPVTLPIPRQSTFLPTREPFCVHMHMLA